MKKLIQFKSKNRINVLTIVMFTLLILSNKLNAQIVNTYTFSQTTGTYTQITGTVLLGSNYINHCVLGGGQVGGCVPNYYTISLPFTFNYAGTNYNIIYVSNNGFCYFSSNNGAWWSADPLLEVSTAISVFGAGIASSNTNHDIRYAVSGTTPNRVVTIQYKNWGSNEYKINCQLKLLETSNIIKMVYGTVDTIPSLRFPRVGISGVPTPSGLGYSIAADFNNRSSIYSWTASVRGTNMSASVSNYSIIKPTTGLTFTFTPPAACTGTPTAGKVISTVNPVCDGQSHTLTTIGTQGSGITYQWQSSPDNVTWTDVAGTPRYFYIGAISVSTYYRCRITCTASGMSAYTPSFLETLSACGGSPAMAAYNGDEKSLIISDNATSALEDSYSFAYPNPSASEFTLDVTTADEKKVMVEIYDMSGIKVNEQYYNLEGGINSLKISVAGKKSGMYLLRLLDANKQVVYRQTIVKE